MSTLPPYTRMPDGWSPNDTPQARWWTLAESTTVRDATDHTVIAHGVTVRRLDRPMGSLDADLVYVGPQRPDEDFASGAPGILDYCHRAEDLDYPDDEPTLIYGPGWYVDTAPDEDDEDEDEEEEPEYRAVDPVTGWQGPVHDNPDAARADADEHDAGCADQGGYGSAIVARRDDDGYCQDLDGQTIWHAHGHTSGALQWRTTPDPRG